MNYKKPEGLRFQGTGFCSILSLRNLLSAQHTIIIYFYTQLCRDNRYNGAIAIGQVLCQWE